MKMYLSFFRMRMTNGLQYRAAAYAGMSTQFAWGFMTILMFSAFYRADSSSFPMQFSQLSSYIWLQQAFLSLFMAWLFEQEIIQSIENGDVALDLCRPTDIYTMWFVRSSAKRIAMMLLRFGLVTVIALLIPKPYGLSLPNTFGAFLWFVPSLLLGMMIIVGINMLIYISSFYTISSQGIRILSISLIELLSGAIIPLSFFPDKLRVILELLPFASMQNTPLLIYNGVIQGDDIAFAVLLQLFWAVSLIVVGKMLMNRAVKRVIVQGG